MASFTSVWVPDYANTVSIAATTAILATATASGPITVGKRRLLHIVAIDVTTVANLVAVSFTMGLSTGTTAPSPVAASPFFISNEGLIIDTGDLYDQINIGNLAAYNAAASLAYSITILSKF